MQKWILFILTVLSLLAGCRSPVYNQAENNVADVKDNIDAARHKSDMSAQRQRALVVKQGMYVDTTPINIDRQPSWLHNRIVIRGDQLPFSYYSRTILSGAGINVLSKYQAGLDQAVNVTMNYSGTLKGALDTLAAKTGYVYTVHGRSVYWQSLITRTFDVAFMPGNTDYLMGQSAGSTGITAGGAAADSGTGGGGGGGGGANGNGTQGSTTTAALINDTSASQYSSQSGKLSLWRDLESTVKQILSPDGKVMVSETTTTVTVRDRPTNVDLVAAYIANLNGKLSKQVLVKVQVLEVNLLNDYNMGINWGIVATAFAGSSYVLNANYGTPVSIVPLAAAAALPQQTLNGPSPFPVLTPEGGVQNTSGKIPAYTVLVNALQQQGKVSIVTEPRVVCLNNQVSVIRIVDQEGYVASVQSTTLGGTGGGANSLNTVTSQITPGNLVTGLTLYILPKIMNDRIYLQVNADLSNKISITQFTSGTSTIQLPSMTAKHFNQRSLISSGDTMILSGFRKLTNQVGAMQFMNVQALGGRGATENNTETIVLITPIILNGFA